MNVDNVFLVLYYYQALDTTTFSNRQQQLQIVFLIFISIYIATQLRALVFVVRNIRKEKKHYISNNSSNEDNNESNNEDKDTTNWNLDIEEVKIICYKDIALIILLNPIGMQDVLTIEMNI